MSFLSLDTCYITDPATLLQCITSKNLSYKFIKYDPYKLVKKLSLKATRESNATASFTDMNKIL
mgnify:CR=1 FL=1